EFRRVLFRSAIGGRAYLAQRFAIDWQKLGPNENTYHGDGHHNADYWSYGEPIISVAAGEVVAALDTVHENTPHEPLPRMPFANLAGNFVTVRIAGNRYVTYAHLRLGSVRVRVHDHVAAGQLLGLLGNSGQATAPHFSGALMFQNEMRVQSRAVGSRTSGVSCRSTSSRG